MFKDREKLLKFITVLNPIFVIYLVYICSWDFAKFVASFSPGLSQVLKENPTLSTSINSAITLFIITFILEGLKSPASILVGVQNNSRKNDTCFYADMHDPKTIHIDCKFNYKYKFLSWLINKLGGLSLKIAFPHWISYKIENITDLQSGVIATEKKEYFLIEINKTFQEKKVEASQYFRVKLMSGALYGIEGEIIPSCEINSNNRFKRFIMKIIVCIFFDITVKNHKIENREGDV